MHVRRRLHAACFQILVIGNVGTEFVGHIIYRNRSAGRTGLPFGYFHRHIDDGTAGFLAQLVLRFAAQIAQSGSIHLTGFQVCFIGIVFSGNIPVGNGYFTGSLNRFRTGNITVVYIFQFRIGQGTRRSKALLRTGKAQPHSCVHLRQGVLPRYLQVRKTCIGAALDAALDIVLYLADSRSDARRDTCPGLIRLDPGQVCAAGHLDIAVIGAAFQIRAPCIGQGIICRIVFTLIFFYFFFIRGRRIYQQRMGAGIGLVHGQAEGHAGIRTGPLAVVSHCQSQCRCRFRSVPDRCIFNITCLGNIGCQNHRVRIPVQVVDGQRRPQRAFFRIIVGSRPSAAGKPVHRRRAGPGAAEHIIRSRIDQGTGCIFRILLAQIYIDAADHGRRLAVYLVPGHAGSRRSIKGCL